MIIVLPVLLTVWLFPGSGLLRKLAGALLHYGLIGLFGISLLDSGLIPLPGGPDGALIVLSQTNNWVLAVTVAALGSTIGCVVLYKISGLAGEAALRKFTRERREKARSLLERYDLLTLMVASLLPPPFPLKLFVISAGVFQLRLWRFVAGILIGRGFRYLVLGYLAFRYGEQATDIFVRHYPAIGAGIALILIGGFIVLHLVRRRSGETGTARKQNAENPALIGR